jgi:hypothetical protein
VELGGGVAGGGLVIGGPVGHVRDCPLGVLDTEPDWFYIYVGRLLQAGLSLGFEAMAKVDFIDVSLTSNDLFASSEWHPDHFGGQLTVPPSSAPARCVFVQGTFAAGIGVAADFAVGYGYEIKEGYTFLTTSGWSVASGSGDGHYATIGVGAGAELAGSFDAAIGVIDWRLGGIDAPSVEVPVPKTPVVAAAEGSGDAGFAVGSHVLNEVGRAALARELARYRALFECPGSVLSIEGDASPTGTEPFNEQLSWRRAKSVYSWVRSALTSEFAQSPGEICALAVPEGRVETCGHGEMEARFHGVADGVEAPQWRMAKVVVNNSELLLL